MPETAKQKQKGLESLAELFINYVEASREAHFTSQKEYYAACRTYAESVRDSLKEKPVQEVARAYSDGLHEGWVRQDPQQYNQAVKQYVDAANDAGTFLQGRLQDSAKTLNDDIQKSVAAGTEAQRAEVEKLLQSFRDVLCKADLKDLDSATLTTLANATLTAAWLKSQFE